MGSRAGGEEKRRRWVAEQEVRSRGGGEEQSRRWGAEEEVGSRAGVEAEWNHLTRPAATEPPGA